MRKDVLSSLCVALVLTGASLVGAEPPAAKPAAPWWLGSKAGVSREVLPPWTPVEAAGADREGLGADLPVRHACRCRASVVTRDAKVLAAPITLRGTADGKELSVDGPWMPDDRRPARCGTARRRRPNRAISVCEGTATIEYDGMIRCDLRLLPKTGKVTLERLALEMPHATRPRRLLCTSGRAVGQRLQFRGPAQGRLSRRVQAVRLAGRRVARPGVVLRVGAELLQCEREPSPIEIERKRRAGRVPRQPGDRCRRRSTSRWSTRSASRPRR